MEEMKAAIYARKSQDEEDKPDDDKSVARQVRSGREFIAKKEWTLDEEHVYQDKGVSGALFSNREQFQRMLRDAAAGAWQHLVFFDLDRFGRNAEKTMAALSTLLDLGVSVWDSTTGQAVDLDSFEGGTMTYLKARFA